MASRTHRDMAIAVSMAEIYCDQMTGYYQAEKPRVKRIRPLLDDLKKASRSAVEFFSKGLDEKDVFVKAETAARKGRNPKTGEAIDIPAKTVVKFRQGKQQVLKNG